MALVFAEREHSQCISTSLNAAFLQFREATWHTPVMDVQTHGKQIMILEDDKKFFRYNGWWTIFLGHIVGLDDPKNKAAVLIIMACYNLTHLHRLTQQMFENMDVLLEENSLRIQPPKRRKVLTYSNALFDLNDYDFWVLRATSRTTAQQWTIHLCGAQYGIHTTSSLWPDFMKKFVYKILAIKPFGTIERYMTAVSKLKSTEAMEFELQSEAMRAVHSAIDPVMQKKGLTWCDVLLKPDADLARHSDKILRVGYRAVDAYVQSTQVTKRQKAERFERWHEEALREDKKNIDEEVLGYDTRSVERRVAGVVWRIRRHEQPDVEEPKERVEGEGDEDVGGADKGE